MTGNTLHNRQIQPDITQIKKTTPIMPIPTHNAKHTSHTQYTQNSYSLSDANTALTSALLHAVGGGGGVGMSQEGNGLGHVSR